jgi:V-type H+-transporting ATPase subunit a
MFGDLGHGFLAFLAGSFMVMFERKLGKAGLGEMFETFFLCVDLSFSLCLCRL